MWPRWMLALVAMSLLAGCASSEQTPAPVYDGVSCMLFDAVAPAGTASIDREAADPDLGPPEMVLFTLTDPQGEVRERWRFSDEECIAFSFDEAGRYEFRAEAEHPDGSCSFFDEQAREVRHDSYVDVRLVPQTLCA